MRRAGRLWVCSSASSARRGAQGSRRQRFVTHEPREGTQPSASPRRRGGSRPHQRQLANRPPARCSCTMTYRCFTLLGHERSSRDCSRISGWIGAGTGPGLMFLSNVAQVAQARRRRAPPRRRPRVGVPRCGLLPHVIARAFLSSLRRRYRRRLCPLVVHGWASTPNKVSRRNSAVRGHRRWPLEMGAHEHQGEGGGQGRLHVRAARRRPRGGVALTTAPRTSGIFTSATSLNDVGVHKFMIGCADSPCLASLQALDAPRVRCERFARRPFMFEERRERHGECYRDTFLISALELLDLGYTVMLTVLDGEMRVIHRVADSLARHGGNSVFSIRPRPTRAVTVAYCACRHGPSITVLHTTARALTDMIS